MTSINSLFPANYLKADDFPQPRVLTINRLEMQEINDNGSKSSKPILIFNEMGDKGLVLNKTNAARISEFLGENVEAWPRMAVELYQEMVDFQGKRVPAVRVRRPQMPQQQAYQPPQGGYQQPPQQGYQQPAPAQYYNGQGQAAPPPQQQYPQQGQQPKQPAPGQPLDDKIPFDLAV
jgi:hypothetical protein